MQTIKRVMLALLIAALLFLAVFILTANFYSTWLAFRHEPISRYIVISRGLIAAGVAAAVAFGLALYWLRPNKGPSSRPDRRLARPGR